MRYTANNEIDCTPEQLWPWLSEPERMKQWMKGLEEIVPDAPGPARAGATYRMRIREGRKVTEYREELLAYEPPRRIRFKITGGSFGTMSFCGENELIDAGGGRTRLRYSGWTEGGSWWCKLLMPIGMLFASFQARGFHGTLKRLAESEARGGSPVPART